MTPFRIDKDGDLKIQRGGKWENASCPLAPKPTFQERTWCGDWCALFGEPIQSSTGVSLELCNKTLHCVPHNFQDERNSTEADT